MVTISRSLSLGLALPWKPLRTYSPVLSIEWMTSSMMQTALQKLTIVSSAYNYDAHTCTCRVSYYIFVRLYVYCNLITVEF